MEWRTVLSHRGGVGPPIVAHNQHSQSLINSTCIVLGSAEGARYSTLLPLVCNFDNMSVSQCHTRRVLLGRDGSLLGLVFDEGNATPSRYQPYLAEPLEARKDITNSVGIVVIGQVLHEERLVRRQVLVWHHRRRRCMRRPQARAAGGLGGSAGQIGRCAGDASSLEPLLFFGGLGGPLLVWSEHGASAAR